MPRLPRSCSSAPWRQSCLCSGATCATSQSVECNCFGIAGRRTRTATRTARAVTLGSLPILVVGVVVAPLVEGPFRNLAVIAAALIVGTVWLGLTTRRAGQRSLDTVNDRDALLVGFAQVAALVPGVSRSGATIGAGYRQGFSPLAATRFSFWLSIPAIVASGLWEARHIGGGLQLAPTLVATVVAFLVGLASISVLLRLASNGRFREMLLYRVVFAGVTIGLAL